MVLKSFELPTLGKIIVKMGPKECVSRQGLLPEQNNLKLKWEVKGNGKQEITLEISYKQKTHFKHAF